MTHKQATAFARALGTALVAKGFPRFKHAELLEMVAHALNYRDWNTFCAHHKHEPASTPGDQP